MKNVPVEHQSVAPPITQEATKVSCQMVNGEWAIEAPPVTAVPSGTSWRSIAGFSGNAEASIGSSGESEAFFFPLVVCVVTVIQVNFWRKPSSC